MNAAKTIFLSCALRECADLHQLLPAVFRGRQYEYLENRDCVPIPVSRLEDDSDEAGKYRLLRCVWSEPGGRRAADRGRERVPAALGAPQRSVPSKSHDTGDEGQRAFEQNCARCHTAPNGLSTRISGTIVRHMRVRANLSRHDEEVLLHYFNP